MQIDSAACSPRLCLPDNFLLFAPPEKPFLAFIFDWHHGRPGWLAEFISSQRFSDSISSGISDVTAPCSFGGTDGVKELDAKHDWIRPGYGNV
jgi:hypothetical protein